MKKKSFSFLFLLLLLPLRGQSQDGVLWPGAKVDGSPTAVVQDAVITGTNAYGKLVYAPRFILGGSNAGTSSSVSLSGTTETVSYFTITAGTNTIAAGKLAYSFVVQTGTLTLPSTSGTISVTSSGPLINVVAQPGNTLGAQTYIMSTSGTGLGATKVSP